MHAPRAALRRRAAAHEETRHMDPHYAQREGTTCLAFLVCLALGPRHLVWLFARSLATKNRISLVFFVLSVTNC